MSATEPASRRGTARIRRHGEYAVAVVLDLVGAGGVLLVAMRSWQTITTPRPRPLADDVLRVAGRTLDAGPTALALVALAGVVAVLATRRLVRRIVGGVLVLAGAGLVWRSLAAASAVDTQRARDLVAARHKVASVVGGTPQVTVHGVWPVLSVIGGVLVVVAGVLTVWHGGRWGAMSARYSRTARPADDDPDRAAATMWNAIDRGDDPTEN